MARARVPGGEARVLADRPFRVKRKRVDQPIRRISSGAMSEDRDRPSGASSGKAATQRAVEADDREARLAAALRANLRRRKAATRGAEPKTGR